MDELSKHRWLKEIIRAPGLSDRQFRLLIALSTYTDADLGSAWPSRQTLADHVGVSSRTVFTMLKELQEAGFIVPMHNRGGRPNEWRLTFDAQRNPATSAGDIAGLSYPQPGNFGPEPGNFGPEPGNDNAQSLPTNKNKNRRAREHTLTGARAEGTRPELAKYKAELTEATPLTPRRQILEEEGSQ